METNCAHVNLLEEKAPEDHPEAHVLVVGAGMAGLTATFDLVEAGRRVVLVDQASSHGGTMTLLDRQFPTDSCGFCQILPHDPGSSDACLKSLLRHPGVEFLPSTRLERVDGRAGAFTVELVRAAVGVDPAKCTHCGRCMEACPESYPDPLHGGVTTRKAIGNRSPLCAPAQIAVDWERCTRCGACVTACPEGAVDLEARDRAEIRRVSAIVLATGFRLHDPSDHLEFGHGRFADVLTSLEFERRFGKALLEGQEEIRRPSDGQVPSRIAWIQCVGSRDEGHSYCSSVCCMIALKEARLCRDLMPEAHLEVFYMDLRACGKGYESYLEASRSRGIRLTRGRPGEVLRRDGRLWLHVEGEDGKWREDPFDMVVLSVGLEATPETRRLAALLEIPLDGDGFLEPAPGSLSRTPRDGVYMAGAAAEPKDVPEAVVQAHEAASLAASHVPPSRGDRAPAARPVTDLMEEDLRVLVALCDCGGTLKSQLDWEALRGALGREPDVVVASGSRICKEAGLSALREGLAAHGANALVVGACTPRWLHFRLREALAPAGIDPNLIQIVNLREQGAWVHGGDAAGATARAAAELRAALARCRNYRVLPPAAGVTPDRGVLVVGGGPAGMSAALALSELGHSVTLVERTAELGGNLRWLRYGLDPAFQPARLLEGLRAAVESTPQVRVFTQTTVRAVKGRPGAFLAELQGDGGTPDPLRVGAVILATGGEMHRPRTFRYGQDGRIITQRELEEQIAGGGLDPRALREVAMIQCVGSRDEAHAYCSRVCCAAALKNALKLTEANPDLRVLVFYRDLRAFGTLERHYRRAREAGVLFVSFDPADPPVLDIQNGDLTLTALDPVVGVRVRFRPDRIVLSSGVEPTLPSGILQGLGLSPDSDGFLPEVNAKFRPLDLRDGVYAGGLALGPAFLGEAMAQGRGAAMRAAAFLAGLEQVPMPQGARVLAGRCSACGLCVEACPFEARALSEEDGHAVVHADLCQACGTCAAVCPNDASQLVGSSDRQILAAIDALLEG